MISVIVPICWGFKPFVNFVSSLVELPVIGEVILIDNNNKLAPTHNVLKHKKIKHHVMQENIFVNPAWNLGASIAENEILCIMSDDVLIDLRVFIEADKFVDKTTGVLGIEISKDQFEASSGRFDDISDIKNLIISGDINIDIFDVYGVPIGGGSIFFIHKDNWIEIPETFKIYYGDNWTFNTQKILGRRNHKIQNAFYYSPWHIASKLGIGSEYQNTDEYWDNENHKQFYKHLEQFCLENKIQIPEELPKPQV